MAASHTWQRELDFSWHCAVLELDLRLPGCRSLKEKRGRLARLSTELRNKFPAVVCEAAAQDVHDRAGLAIAVLGTDPSLAQRIFLSISDRLTQWPDLEVVSETTITL